MVDFKAFAKRRWEGYKKSSAEQREYNKKVREEVLKAKREAYLKASIVQARLQQERRAKAVYNPPVRQNQGMSPEAYRIIYGMLMPTANVQKVARKIKKRRKTTKRVRRKRK